MLFLTGWLSFYKYKMQHHESSYVVFLKETKVTNHTNPHKHGGGSQQDTAHSIISQELLKERNI